MCLQSLLPALFFWTFLLLSFFLPVVDDDFFGGWRKLWGESRNLSRVMRRITSVKHHLKGGVQKIIRAAPFQAINNDWSLTETFSRSMINKSLPHARAHQCYSAFNWGIDWDNLNETKPCFLYFNHTRTPGKTPKTTSCNISPFTVMNDLTKNQRLEFRNYLA